MRQQREAAIRQVLRSTQVSLAALFCGQREGLVSADPGVIFPPAFFRPAPVRGAPHLGPTDAKGPTDAGRLMRTFGRQDRYVATQPGVTLRVLRARAVAAVPFRAAAIARNLK